MPEGQHTRVLPAKPLRSAVRVVAMLAVLYAVELFDAITFGDLDENGIQPRSVDGLDGVLWAPLLHDGWGHLIANTVPLLVLGWLVMAGGMRTFLGVTGVIWVIGGLGTWLVASDGVHIGASGVAFGWLVFLLVRGFFLRSPAQIAIAALLFVFWGGMLWGVLPGQPGVSWEGHLFGAVGGLVAAWLLGRSARPLRPSHRQYWS